MMPQVLSTPKGDITIRIATQADATELFKLRMEALTFHPEAFAADVEMTKTRGVEAWVSQITNESKNQSGVIFIACARDELVGMTGVGRGHWPKTQHSAIVWGVYVTPAWRGQHVAEGILEECIRWAGENSIVVLKLGVVTTNQAAIHCYQHAGFTIYGTEPKSNYLDGKYYDEYLMAKLI